jgi:hypothetical protein
MRAMKRLAIVLSILAAPVATAQEGAVPPAADLSGLEAAVAADPENLFLAADYRQAIITSKDFDRSIDLFEKLARSRTAGPNVHISLALAYVDKVPPSGEIRRLHLARDAIDELSAAIDKEPTVLAYYIRGLINLYFNRFIFNRVTRGIADLERALAMSTQSTPHPLVARIYVSLGDGYWQDDKREKAREVWTAGASRYPDHEGLRSRLVPEDQATRRVVRAALYAGRRVDTSLADIDPR